MLVEPILTSNSLGSASKIAAMNVPGFKTATVSIIIIRTQPEKAIDRVFWRWTVPTSDGANIIP